MERDDHKIFVFFVILRMLLACPAVDEMTSAVVNFPIMVFLYIYIFAKSNNAWNNVVTLIPIFLCVFLNVYFSSWGQSAFINYLYVVFQWYLWPLIGFFAVESLSTKSQKTLLWSFVVVYAFVAVTTYIGCLDDPNAARYQANGGVAEEDPIYIKNLKLKNIGGFGYIYTLVPFVPLLLAMFKTSLYGKTKIIGIVLFAQILLTIYQSQYTTAVVTVALVLIFFLLPLKRTPKNVNYVMIVMFILIIVSMPAISKVLEYTSSNTGDVMGQRLSELSYVASGQDATETDDFGSRVELWTTSIETFFKHPLLGCYHLGKTRARGLLGGHSFVFDMMGRLGICGLLLLILAFRKYFTLYIKPYKESSIYPYIYVSYFIVLFQCMVNTVCTDILLVFFIPVLMHLYTSCNTQIL